MKTLGVYIHIPYCLSKCPYCDFYSVTDSRSQDRYLNALLLHMEDYSAHATGYDVDTVFIGGGTPSLLSPAKISKLLNGVTDNFSLRHDAEITIEMNPATLKRSALRSLRSAGVNRLSIGLQSVNDNELRALGRAHTFSQFEECFSDARRSGFDNVNIDLMYGIPGQTHTSLAHSLDTVIGLDPEHISLYGLKIEENTPFFERKNELDLPDEDTEADMYMRSIERLTKNGYNQYEISNFSKPGRACLHNLKYWNCEEYLGFGASAHSFFRNHRFAAVRDIATYVEAMEYPSHDVRLISEDYEIRPQERLGEYVMLRLRLKEGVDTDAFAERFGLSFERMFGKYLKVYVAGGFMEKNGRFYRFTPRGMYVSNYILSAMLDFKSELIDGVADGTDR